MSKTLAKTEKEPIVINRISVVLKEERKTGKWLAEQIGFASSTLSNWSTNKKQPNIYIFYLIALTLRRNIQDLFYSSAQISDAERNKHLKTLREMVEKGKRTGKSKKGKR